MVFPDLRLTGLGLMAGVGLSLFGFSYLHLRATEAPSDLVGTYFREFRKW